MHTFSRGRSCIPCLPARILFTVGALDNLDHNPSSTTSQSSFHGTGIGMFPNFHPKTSRVNVDRLEVSGKHAQLPEIYTTVAAVAIAKSNTVVPEVKVEQTKVCLDKALEAENEWYRSPATFEKRRNRKETLLHRQLITPLKKHLHMRFQPCVQCYLSSMSSLLHLQ